MNAIADFLIMLVVLVPIPKEKTEERSFVSQTPSEFQKTFDELHPKGWRLKRIEGYEKYGESRLDSVWHKPAEPVRFWCSHNIDLDQYKEKLESAKKDGFVETLKSTWKVNGKDYYWTVLEKK